VILTLIGLPGSGKGTQGQMLAKKLGIPLISIGDMLRTIIRENREEARLLNQYISEGKLVPSELTNKIVQKILLVGAQKNGCIFDGYPRNLLQAKFLENITNQKIITIFFDIEDEVVIKRILGRFNCGDCAKIYNSYYKKPIIDGVCDSCGSTQFIYRQDDSEEVIRKRIQEYKKETSPLISYYKNSENFYSIDAQQGEVEVTSKLNALLKTI
jgi:adenylate kinase